MSDFVMQEARFWSRSVGQRVTYRTLAPDDHDPGRPLPLIVHLHGAMSSAAFLDTAKPIYDRAWASGNLPPAVVVCASTPTSGGFYIDFANGPAWETLVGTELPEQLEADFDLSGIRAAIGFSMGGYGALKLAARNPDRYRAVAALCPAVFPAERADEVPARNRPAILGELNQAMGKGIDGYSDNCIPTLIRHRRDAIAASGLRIFLECGERDEFGLYDGALHLHRVLESLQLPHDWVSLPEAGHADAVAERLAKAIDALGEALKWP